MNVKFDSEEVNVQEEGFYEDTEVTLYKIADIKETGEPYYNDSPFENSGINLNELSFPVDISEYGLWYVAYASSRGIVAKGISQLDSDCKCSFENLESGVYMLVHSTGGDQRENGKTLTFQPYIFNNLKYDERGNVVGTYSELNLTVYLDVTFPNPDYDITKKIVSEPKNGKTYQVGEKIKYEITVTNKGNCRLDSITIIDKITSGYEGKSVEEKTFYLVDLEKGETETIEYEYEVKPKDGGYPIKNALTAVTTKPPTPPKGEKLPEVELPEVEEVKGSIEVCKVIVDNNFEQVTVSDATIYVALFADENGEQRISDVKSIKFENTSDEQRVKFTDLKVDTEYYVFEVDQEGNTIDSMNIDGKYYKINQNGIETYLDETNNEKIAVLVNEEVVTYGSITVTKNLKDLSDGKVVAEDETFYVRLFLDEKRTMPASEVEPMRFVNTASLTITFDEVEIGQKYYVSETDELGIPIDNGVTDSGGIFGAIFSNGNLVEITKESPHGSIEFENVFSERPPEY